MIKVLSNDTIQKIAAGEVVERPASIVKELVENSIDAGAKNISVEIKNGGKKYIKIIDDGTGIPSNEIELAFVRHATSKIDEFNDLYDIVSMGFRGEALASIVSVANIIMMSKNIDEEIGTYIEYDNNNLIDKKTIAMNTGTTVEVKNLFEYIPARKKFLNSDISETNKITQLMYVFAIGNPDISFTYIKDERKVFSTNSAFSKEQNFNLLFGKDFIENSISIDAVSNNYKIKGTISNNKYYKGNRSMQFIYVNRRYIENTEIVEAIEKAYSNMIPQGRFPIYEIHIEVLPENIDINIHPNKQKIKFSFNTELLELLYDTVHSLLIDNEKPKEVSYKQIENKKISFHELNKSDGYKRVLDAYKQPLNLSTLNSELNNEEENLEEESIEEIIKFNIVSDEIDEDNEINFLNEDENIYSSIDEISQIKMEIDDLDFKCVLMNKYIIFENQNIEKLVLIDIYRANQRIIFDKSIHNNEIIRQDLLIPMIINLTPRELEIFNQNKNIFEELGFEVDYFDENSIAIRQIPYYYDEPSKIEDFKLILDSISDNKKDYLDKKSLILQKSIAIATHKTKSISEDEAIMLYKDLIKTSNPLTTENGKNIIFELDFKELVNFLEK